MNKKESIETLISVLLVGLSALYAGVLVGAKFENSDMKRRAIKHGVAEIVMVNEFGKKEFRWKECEQ